MLNGPFWLLEIIYDTFGVAVLTHSLGGPIDCQFQVARREDSAAGQDSNAWTLGPYNLVNTCYSNYLGHIGMVYSTSDKSQWRNHRAELLELKQRMTLAWETYVSDGQLEKMVFCIFHSSESMM